MPGEGQRGQPPVCHGLPGLFPKGNTVFPEKSAIADVRRCPAAGETEIGLLGPVIRTRLQPSHPFGTSHFPLSL